MCARLMDASAGGLRSASIFWIRGLTEDGFAPKPGCDLMEGLHGMGWAPVTLPFFANLIFCKVTGFNKNCAIFGPPCRLWTHSRGQTAALINDSIYSLRMRILAQNLRTDADAKFYNLHISILAPAKPTRPTCQNRNVVLVKLLTDKRFWPTHLVEFVSCDKVCGIMVLPVIILFRYAVGIFYDSLLNVGPDG